MRSVQVMADRRRRPSPRSEEIFARRRGVGTRNPPGGSQGEGPVDVKEQARLRRARERGAGCWPAPVCRRKEPVPAPRGSLASASRRPRSQPLRVPRLESPLAGTLAHPRARLVLAGGWVSSGSSVRRRKAPSGRALHRTAARVGRHRAPAAGPPPLRRPNPVSTGGSLVGGEWRDKRTKQELCQAGFGKFSRRSKARPNPSPRCVELLI